MPVILLCTNKPICVRRTHVRRQISFLILIWMRIVIWYSMPHLYSCLMEGKIRQDKASLIKISIFLEAFKYSATAAANRILIHISLITSAFVGLAVRWMRMKGLMMARRPPIARSTLQPPSLSSQRHTQKTTRSIREYVFRFHRPLTKTNHFLCIINNLRALCVFFCVSVCETWWWFRGNISSYASVLLVASGLTGWICDCDGT